jgi:L-ascorbate peroxidase
MQSPLMVMQAPVLLRLAFHDAATHEVSAGDGGANASVQYEFGRPENTGLKRGWYEADPWN